MKYVAPILLFCAWVGGTLTSLSIIGYDLIQWFTIKKDQKYTFSPHFWAALAFFVITELFAFRTQILSGIETLSSNTEIILLTLIFAAVLFILLLFLLFCIYIYKQFRQVAKGVLTSKTVSYQTRKEALAFLITVGIILLYLFLPLAAGKNALQGNPNYNDSIQNTWCNGVINIARFMGSQSEANVAKSLTYQELISYTLFYVILLGVCFAAFKIIYTIMGNAIAKASPSIWDQYSSAIGLFSVCISILLSMQEIKFGEVKKDILKIMGIFFKDFAIVLFVATGVILSLEAMNLLIDMRRKLIRKEGKLIFVAVVGQVTLILLNFIKSVARATESALGTEKTGQASSFMDTPIEKVILYMQEELEEEDRTSYSFPAFHEKVTRK